MSDDWYRNETWTPEIEQAFETKIRRARSQKQQYLRIQASHLAGPHPEVCLSLLKRYYELGKSSDLSSAFVTEAEAYRSLGNTDAAIEAYEKALAREQEFPHSTTQANRDLAVLIVSKDLHQHYDRALELLSDKEKGLTFPIHTFIDHAAIALIANERGQLEKAKHHATIALDAAKLTHSGLRYHTSLGLVNSTWTDWIQKLQSI